MDRPQLIHRLRIAVSVFFAVVTVAICVLWARSYWRTDSFRRVTKGNHVISLWSSDGALRFADTIWGVPYVVRPGWTFDFLPGRTRLDGNSRFLLESSSDDLWIGVPHWFATLVTTLLIPLPWIVRPLQFSLRTLLIATTLVAVVLGLGVWAAG